MPPKKKKAEDPVPKLGEEEGLQLENLNLAVEREVIFTRCDLLNKECKRLKHRYLKLEEEYDSKVKELENERARALADRNEAQDKELRADTEIKALQKLLVDKEEQLREEMRKLRDLKDGEIKQQK